MSAETVGPGKIGTENVQQSAPESQQRVGRSAGSETETDLTT